LRVKPPHGRVERVFGDETVALRGDEADLRGQLFELGIEHVQRRALADLLLLLHAFERDLIGVDGVLGGI
jgi:hypothetical protein